MVRSYGANLTDITDRSSRALGVMYGLRERSFDPQALSLNDERQLNVQSVPWWDYSPRGRAVCMDDFEGVFNWVEGSSTISKAGDPGYVHDGSYAMKMVTGTTAGAGAAADRRFFGPDPETEYLYLQFWWALTAFAETTPRDFYVLLTIEDDWLDASYKFGARYLHYDGGVEKRRLQYRNNAGAWVDGAAPFVKWSVGVIFPFWNFLQMIISRDPTTGYKYKNIWLNDKSIMVDGFAGEVGAYAFGQHEVTLYCTTDAAAATTAYVDDFVLNTQAQFSWET